MPYSTGNVLYFTPYYFENGKFKNKYFIVLASSGDRLVIAGLPTSQDHVPSQLPKIHGCINADEMCFNCYYFEKNRVISECGQFSFPMDTYLYGEEIDILSRAALESKYSSEGDHYIKLCRLSNDEFVALKDCLSTSGRVKQKIKRHLTPIEE